MHLVSSFCVIFLLFFLFISHSFNVLLNYFLSSTSSFSFHYYLYPFLSLPSFDSFPSFSLSAVYLFLLFRLLFSKSFSIVVFFTLFFSLPQTTSLFRALSTPLLFFLPSPLHSTPFPSLYLITCSNPPPLLSTYDSLSYHSSPSSLSLYFNQFPRNE